MTISMNEKHMNEQWSELVAAMKENNKDVREAHSRAIIALRMLATVIDLSEMSAVLKEHMLAIIEEVIE